MKHEASQGEAARSTCTPITESGLVLSSLIDLWEGWFPGSSFLDEFVDPMWSDKNTSGLDQISELKGVETMVKFPSGEVVTPEDREALLTLGILMVSCAFCVQAMKAEKNSPEAWSYASDANLWLGLLLGLISKGGIKAAASALGKSGANALHKENRAMKKNVWDWCEENMARFTSMDSAAEAIAGKIVPISFRTARKWVGAWKKLPATGTA